MKRIGSLSSLAVIFVLALVFSAGCEKKKEKPRENPPAPVALANAQKKDMPYYIMSTGMVFTQNFVTVRSKVTGYLKTRDFQQGTFVNKGDLLFVIDPTQYRSQLKSLEAQLKSNKDSYQQAYRDYKRYQRLADKEVVAREEFEQYRLNMETARDTIAMTEAEIENTKNDLTYCFIHSPLRGLAGYIMPNVGDLITADEDELVVINQISPIGVNFYLPQKYMLDIRKHMQEGPLEVLAFVSDNSTESCKGTLTFYDNEVDKKTGTIWLQATFPNEDHKLWPGNFVRVWLKVYEEKDAVIVPLEATCFGPDGNFVWVAEKNGTVSIRPVEVERRSGKYDILTKGIQPGDVVVTDGQIRLYPGAKFIQSPSPDARQEIIPGYPAVNATAATNSTNATAGKGQKSSNATAHTE